MGDEFGHDDADEERLRWFRYVSCTVIVLIWLRNGFLEVLQIIGFVSIGRWNDYFLNLSNFVDFCRLTLTGVMAVLLIFDFSRFQAGSLPLRLAFGITGLFRWIKVLYC